MKKVYKMFQLDFPAGNTKNLNDVLKNGDVGLNGSRITKTKWECGQNKPRKTTANKNGPGTSVL